jgi:hypothetical protein
MRLRSRLTKTKGTLVVVAGLISATIVVGVALALVLVQVGAIVSSNEFATTTTTSSTTTTTIPPPTNGLQVALSTGPAIGTCGSFSAGPLSLAAIGFDLNSTLSQSTGQFLCIGNTGTSVISPVTIGVSTVSSGESGCSTDEGTVDPEGVTCGTVGEMASLVQFEFVLTDFDDTDCIGAVTTGNILSSGALGIGLTCVYRIDLQFAGSPTYDQKLAASTDTAEFSIDVTASP